MKYVVTGGNGYVGSALVDHLLNSHHFVISLVRRPIFPPIISPFYKEVVVDFTNLQKIDDFIFYQADAVIHLAGRTLASASSSHDSLNELRIINSDITFQLAKRTANAKIPRFVFLSSIKVNGERTPKGFSFNELVNNPPTDPYGRSKYEAELRLIDLAKSSQLEYVIIRPPLIYGPGAKGNFNSLVRLVSTNLPLPFASIRNKRSFIAISNLIDFIILCSSPNLSPNAANEIFVVSDNEDISTSTLLKRIASSLGSRTFIFPFPNSILRILFRLLGMSSIFDKLFDDLVLDTSKSYRLLNWVPPTTFDEQIKLMFQSDI